MQSAPMVTVVAKQLNPMDDFIAFKYTKYTDGRLGAPVCMRSDNNAKHINACQIHTNVARSIRRAYACVRVTHKHCLVYKSYTEFESDPLRV